MTEAAREARNHYQREWRRRNPGKTKEYQRRYWERKARELGYTKEKSGGGGAKNDPA